MKKLNREPLSASTLALLDARTQQVLAAADPKEEAQRSWKQQDNKAFEEIRSTLESMWRAVAATATTSASSSPWMPLELPS
jgi:hypothetical protein